MVTGYLQSVATQSQICVMTTDQMNEEWTSVFDAIQSDLPVMPMFSVRTQYCQIFA